MDTISSKHLAQPENTNINMKKLPPDTQELNSDPTIDTLDISRMELSQDTTTQNQEYNTSETNAPEMQDSNTGLHADDSSTIPASSSSTNLDIPVITDSKLPLSSHPPNVPEISSTKNNRFKGRRRTLRLSRKQKEAVKRNAKLVSKRFLMFLVSHVGLTCLVVAYSIMGGFIFQALEGSNEVRRITHIHEIRMRHVSKLWNVTDELNIFDPFLWREKANAVLTGFQLEIYEAVKDKGWDGTDNVTSKELQWTFAGSLLYSVTVVTTIGYGHLTPKTMVGRVVTMLYALIGIPMTLLCLANIGSFMARCFRLLWKQIVCKPCRNRLKRRSMYMAAKRKAAAAVYIASIAKQKRAERVEAGTLTLGARSVQEDVTVSCSDSPAVVHDSTALLGKKQEEKAACSPLMSSGQGRYGLSGGFEKLRDSLSSDAQNKSMNQDSGGAASVGGYTPYSSSAAYPTQPQAVPEFINNDDGGKFHSAVMKACEKSDDPAICQEIITTTTTTSLPDPQSEDVLMEEAKKASKEEVIRVPIMVCLVMVAAYIVLGAVLFSLWEHWNYFDSSYFCFITLSTIGFGDIVPGYEHNTWDNQAKRVSCTLYLLFGLALVAMCFDLIQTECREIFNDLAKSLGFADDNTDG
ncbi:hypothetical protein ACOMHN_059492 [Nucella lapillus]